MKYTLSLIATSLFIVTFPFFLLAQGQGVPLGSNTYHILDRLDIKSDVPSNIHTSLKFYLRSEVTNYGISVDTLEQILSLKDRGDLSYLFKDNNEWLHHAQKPRALLDKQKTFFRKVGDQGDLYTMEPIGMPEASKESPYFFKNRKPLLRYFYKTPGNLFEYTSNGFYVKVNPLFNFRLAKSNDTNGRLFENQRGISIRGGIDDRIYFYSEVLESQALYADYITERIENDVAVPGAGFYKNYKSEIFDSQNAYDFLNAQGYIGFNVTKRVGIQLGHGRHFIGNGYRSMLLSDQSNNYFYLKLNTKIGRFHYQNIFAETIAEYSKGDRVLPKKYFSAHYLSCNITNNLSVGVFETVVFSRNNHIELQYLNPVILYRTIEQMVGSPDNVLIGLDVKWNLLKRFSFYGQLMIDEFKFDELFLKRDGWWANKYGIQLGLKYIDAFGLDHLDLQTEYNMARPYTYTHSDSTASYTHYNQALAHPLGANFKEYIFKVRYQPIKKWTIEGRLILANYGADTDSTFWGNNIMVSNTLRVQNYNNVTTQGVFTKTLLFGIDVSYQIYHNVFLEGFYFYRKKDIENIIQLDKINYFGGGVRINLSRNNRLDF